jgi:hypothetical protein
MTDHPITPPPELVEQWHDSWIDAKVKHDGLVDFIATQAARWGADQELEACCEWLRCQNLVTHCALIPSLRAARRPRPPSLKEQALIELGDVYNRDKIDDVTYDIIRKALEQLDD